MQGLNKVLAPIKRSLKLLISRSVVSIVNDSYARQNLQIRLHTDEVSDEVERFQNYGISSVPVNGEAIVLSVGGKRNHLVAIVVDDKGSRPTGLNPGDVIIYHHEGHNILLSDDGSISANCKTFSITASDEVFIDASQTHFTGDIDIVGKSTAADHISNGISGEKHDHEKKVGKPT